MGTAPDFLVIGHITRDVQADGTFRLGGTAFYAAVTAARLGCRVAVYTAARRDLDLSPLHEATEGVTTMCQPASSDTVFHNCYEGGRRRQFLLERAPPLPPTELPAPWRGVPLVLLGPVAQEVAPAWTRHFPDAVVGGCLQGWLRAWDRAGRVHFTPWEEAHRWLPHFAVAFLSEEDIQGNQTLAAAYAAHCPLLIWTAGARGATLYQQSRPRPVVAFPVREVDPTGAGDVFAAAFLVRYAEGVRPAEAARFAAAAAALSVQGHGAEAIPQRPAVEVLLQETRNVAPTP